MFDREDRFDALVTEAHVLLCLWNLQIEYKGLNPDIPFEQIAVHISQSDFAVAAAIGKRTLERVCSRLEERGFLRRWRSGPRSPYVYQVSSDAVTAVVAQLIRHGTVRLHFVGDKVFLEFLREKDDLDLAIRTFLERSGESNDLSGESQD